MVLSYDPTGVSCAHRGISTFGVLVALVGSIPAFLSLFELTLWAHMCVLCNAKQALLSVGMCAGMHWCVLV